LHYSEARELACDRKKKMTKDFPSKIVINPKTDSKNNAGFSVH